MILEQRETSKIRFQLDQHRYDNQQISISICQNKAFKANTIEQEQIMIPDNCVQT